MQWQQHFVLFNPCCGRLIKRKIKSKSSLTWDGILRLTSELLEQRDCGRPRIGYDVRYERAVMLDSKCQLTELLHIRKVRSESLGILTSCPPSSRASEICSSTPHKRVNRHQWRVHCSFGLNREFSAFQDPQPCSRFLINSRATRLWIRAVC